MVEVLGSLVLEEENPRTPGDKNSKPVGGGAAGSSFLSGEKEWFLGFLCFFSICQNCPPLLCELKTSIYMQNVAVPQNWSLNFFLFVNLIFLNFFYFFLKRAISTST